eukprot:scaffold762_cov363-Pavlova_lutheri.AAC.69
MQRSHPCRGFVNSTTNPVDAQASFLQCLLEPDDPEALRVSSSENVYFEHLDKKNAGIGRGERRDAVGRPSIGGADWEPHEETGWVCIKQEQRPLLHASNFAGVQELDDFEFALRLCFFPVGGVLSKPEGYALSRGNEAIESSDAVLNISRW